MIILEEVTKRYGNQVAVDNLSLKIRPGVTLGFLGQNGAGKTTAMKMVVGLTRPNSGKITIGGRSSMDMSVRFSMGYMPESPYFYERLTGEEFLRFCADIFGVEADAKKIKNLMDSVGLGSASGKRIGDYSKGMKQRLGFVQALINNPEYVFLDEPLDGLDPLGRKEIKSVIRRLRSEGKTVFFNSHILYDIEELCDEIGIMHKGRLIYSGSVNEFCRGKTLEESFVSEIEALEKTNSSIQAK